MATKKKTKAIVENSTVSNNELLLDQQELSQTERLSNQAGHLPAEITPPSLNNTSPITTIIDTKGVLQSKRYTTAAAEFKSPAELFAPALSLLEKTGGLIEVDGDDEIIIGETDEIKHVAFPRLKLTTTFQIDDELTYQLGMVIALNIGKPIVKIYRGAITRACMNLSVWGSDDVQKFELQGGLNNELMKTYINKVTEQIQESKRIVDHLKSVIIPHTTVPEIIGKMILKTKAEKTYNGTQSIMFAVDQLTDKDSKYYCLQEGFNGWKLFNAFTEPFNKRSSFFDIPEKSRDTYKLLKEICLS